MSNTLKKHLLGVFLAAAMYSPEATIKFLEKDDMLGNVLFELFTLQPEFKHQYEQQLFVVGISQLLQLGVIWPEASQQQ